MTPPSYNPLARLDDLKDLPSQLALLQEVTECRNCFLIRSSITDQINASKAASGRNLDQGYFNSRIAARIPLRLQVDP